MRAAGRSRGGTVWHPASLHLGQGRRIYVQGDGYRGSRRIRNVLICKLSYAWLHCIWAHVLSSLISSRSSARAPTSCRIECCVFDAEWYAYRALAMICHLCSSATIRASTAWRRVTVRRLGSPLSCGAHEYLVTWCIYTRQVTYGSRRKSLLPFWRVHAV